MTKEFIINFLNLLISAYMFLVFVRVILSWIPSGAGSFRKVVTDLTEPVLAPLRKIIPPIAGLDLSPIALFIILQILQGFIAGI